MGTLYFDSGGAATNSGSSDDNAAPLSGTGATVSGTTVDLSADAPDLSGVVTSGDNQSAIYIDNSNVANRKIFWITAVDNGAKTVTVDASVTVSASPSAWRIGGRISAAGVVDGINALRNGDAGLLNTDISAAINAAVRNPGAGANGYVKIIGKSGARRVFANTGNGTFLTAASGLGSKLFLKNLEMQSQGTGGCLTSTVPTVVDDVRMTDAGTNAWVQNSGYNAFNSEISGANGTGLSGNQVVFLFNCYIHDNAGDGVNTSSAGTHILVGSIVERNSDRNLELSGASTSTVVYGSTIYRSDNSGIEETNATQNSGFVALLQSILKDNGNAGGEANIELQSLTNRIQIVYDNCISIAGGRGGDNVSGYTLDASDITTDPLFVDPDAAAGSRNFGLQSGSPAKGISYTFPGSLSVSYRDLGAVQSEGGSGGLRVHPGMTGGMRG
jgi:parallel beta helix pectate lyase-like protein